MPTRNDRRANTVVQLLKRAEAAEAKNVVLKEAVRLAKVRLEICLGRFAGCDIGHEVSEIEIPGWIEQMDEVLEAK